MLGENLGQTQLNIQHFVELRPTGCIQKYMLHKHVRHLKLALFYSCSEEHQDTNFLLLVVFCKFTIHQCIERTLIKTNQDLDFIIHYYIFRILFFIIYLFL